MTDDPATSTGDTPSSTDQTEDHDVEELTRSIDGLTIEVRGVRSDMHDERRRYNRRFLLVSLVVLAALAGIGGLLVRTSDIRRISDQRAHDLASARVASCLQYNDQQQRARDATVKVALAAVVTGLTQLAEDPAHLTPAEEAVKARVVAEVERSSSATAQEQYPFRDCSPAGIARYLQHPPADPATIPPTTAVRK